MSFSSKFQHFGLKMKNANLLKDLKTMFSSAFWLRWAIGVPITLIYFLLLYSIDFPTKNGLLAEKTAKIGPKYPKNGAFNLIFQVLKKNFLDFSSKFANRIPSGSI